MRVDVASASPEPPGVATGLGVLRTRSGHLPALGSKACPLPGWPQLSTSAEIPFLPKDICKHSRGHEFGGGATGIAMYALSDMLGKYRVHQNKMYTHFTKRKLEGIHSFLVASVFLSLFENEHETQK